MSSRVHGMLDYLVGLLLLVAPYLLGFANGGPEQIVPQAAGALVLIVSLVTRYELSVVKIIPYRTHLTIDVVQAVALLASPWLLGFAARVWWPHVLVALIELGVVALSWRNAGGAGHGHAGDLRGVRHNEPGAPTNRPHQTPEQMRDRAPAGTHTAREGAHRQTGAGTSPDPAFEVADPHPSDEGNPYEPTSPVGDRAPPSDIARGRADLGPNPAIHDGNAPPRPKNAGSGPS
jgi:hypothetical protein